MRRNINKSRSFSLWCGSKCFHKQSPPEEEMMKEEANGSMETDSKRSEKKPGGWKAMPFILGNETCERLASFGLLANFMVYLLREYHLDQVSASNILNIWFGFTSFAPLIGAYISDAHAGRFPTIAVASFASLLGMVIITLTAWLPQLQPPKCNTLLDQHCLKPNKLQMTVLLLAMSLLSIGSGGIRPCSIPFGVDQFDPTTAEGIQGINSFYNWYYMSFNMVLLITQTVVVYIQDAVSWLIGFGLPTLLMGCSIVLFFVGSKIYVHVEPEGSIFSGISQVFLAAYKKRHLKLPAKGDEDKDGVFYDPPMKENAISKLPLTYKYRFLNKAAVIMENDLKPDGTPADNWRICSIQQEEEVKCLIKVIPIWISGIISFTATSQQSTFTISQALIMDKHLGPKFQIPAASITVISLITVALWLPFYDRVIVPSIQKITKIEGGITMLQRIGIGMVFACLSMVVAGFVERERRAFANSNPNGLTLSVFWLAPQLIVMGLCEAFNIIGQIEFFNKEFPDKMRGFGNSLFLCSFAGSSYLSSAIIITVRHAFIFQHDTPLFSNSQVISNTQFTSQHALYFPTRNFLHNTSLFSTQLAINFQHNTSLFSNSQLIFNTTRLYFSTRL